MMNDAFIYDAVRTPRGKGKKTGALSSIAPQKLISQLVIALGERHATDFSEHVSRLILGCVGQINSQGGHIALVSKFASALPDSASASTVNNYCVSGLSAIGDGTMHIRGGDDGLILAGGVESLSQVGFYQDQADYYSNPDVMQELKWVPPILGAELLATYEGFTKANLDALTITSHEKAAHAWENGHYQTGVVSIHSDLDDIILNMDEYVQTQPDRSVIERAKPAFAGTEYQPFDKVMLQHNTDLTEISHVHSIANCPGPADGAALILMGSKKAGEKLGRPAKARIISYAEYGGDPILQFSAGFHAMEKALKTAKLTIQDLNLVEFMEAFAAPPLKFLRDYNPDPSKVNVNGGHLAMGHPMGATGAILVTTLLHELERRKENIGMAVALGGSGIGAAIIIERVDS